jgi:hypothetical protein
MNEWPIVALGITIILVLTGFILIFRMWKQRKEGVSGYPHYRALVFIGCVWIPVGVVFIIQKIMVGYAFIGLGLAYMAIGLANRDKWEG